MSGVGILALGVLAHDEEGSIERMLTSVVRQTRWRALPADHRQVVVYANGCSDATADAESARSMKAARNGPRTGASSSSTRTSSSRASDSANWMGASGRRR